MYIVYELIDPRTGETRHVGKISDAALAKFSGCGLGKHCQTNAKLAWVFELRKLGMQPITLLHEQRFLYETEAEQFKQSRIAELRNLI